MAVMIQGDQSRITPKMRNIVTLFEENGLDNAILYIGSNKIELTVCEEAHYTYYVLSDRWVRVNQVTGSKITGKYVSVFPAIAIDYDIVATNEIYDEFVEEANTQSILDKIKNKLKL